MRPHLHHSMPLLASVLLFQAVQAASPRLSVDTVSSAPNASKLNLFAAGSHTAWNGTAGSYIAFRIVSAPQSLFLTWTDAYGLWSDSIGTKSSCKDSNSTTPRAYAILTSANSTTGIDGTWDTSVSVVNNVVTARAHQIALSGRRWVKFAQISGTSRIDEIALYDANLLGNDRWLFLGNSITEITFKGFVPDTGFAEQVNDKIPGRYPAFLRGGIPCIHSYDASADISKYLKYASNVKYWAIELGTNDGWGNGSYNLPGFKSSMTIIIDSALAHGITPIIARVMATDSAVATWQIDPGYPAAVDSLQKAFHLPAGPDFNGWFRAHPEQIGSDGVHPNAAGAASIQRMWAQVALQQQTASLAIPLPDRKPTPNGNAARLNVGQGVPRGVDPLGRAAGRSFGVDFPVP